MIHLITYSLRIKLRNFSMVFWPLVFPLILGTFFFFAFGNISEADFETVSVAVVKPETSNPLFLGFLNQIENNTDDLISVSEMPEQKALDALKSGKIAGAGLDVYEEETDFFFEDRSDMVKRDTLLSLLVSMPNVVLTSHQAFLTKEALHNIAQVTLENLDAYFKDGTVLNPVQ